MPNNKKSLWPLNKIDDCFALKKLDMNSKGINFSWELVPELNKILKRTVTSITIAPDARISRNATIEGPVIIESKVAIQDYAKIVGPAYICEGTIVGNCSLIRESFIGNNCVIGYLVDVARSFLGNSCWSSRSHIADSVFGNNVNLGGGAVVTSLRLDNKTIGDTGLIKLGSLIGARTQIGANAVIMPGTMIGSDCIIGPGVLLNENLPDGIFCEIKQTLIHKKNHTVYIPETHSDFRKSLLKTATGRLSHN